MHIQSDQRTQPRPGPSPQWPELADFTPWANFAKMSDHPSCRESVADEGRMPTSTVFLPVNLKESDRHKMPLHKGNKKMSPNTTFAISSGVEPVLPAPPATSPKKARLLHEREQPTSPEKKEVYHIINIES